MEERVSALETALNNEKKEREFYLHQARRTKNAVGKAMFEQIAAEELEHYNMLKELHEKWVDKEKWPETIPLTVNGTNVSHILNEAVARAKNQAKSGDADDLEAIRTAIEFEGAGVKFYKQLRNMVVDRKEKDFFDLLAKIEHDHFLSLKDTEEYLTNPSAWYLKTEGSVLNGA